MMVGAEHQRREGISHSIALHVQALSSGVGQIGLSSLFVDCVEELALRAWFCLPGSSRV